jgi:hypothetical protein
VDWGSDTYFCCRELPVLLWLFVILNILQVLPHSCVLPKEACLWSSCLLSIPGLADAVTSERRCARNAGLLLEEISFQIEVLYSRALLLATIIKASSDPWSRGVPWPLV